MMYSPSQPVRTLSRCRTRSFRRQELRTIGEQEEETTSTEEDSMMMRQGVFRPTGLVKSPTMTCLADLLVDSTSDDHHSDGSSRTPPESRVSRAA
mmetsp:Transcript_34491/g.51182  ORF Transcript_34491/g.51182 Transcript_34491/m.51182 type:complete len:95 (+) Transcript_34491:44-328(+)|eukprot:CAMPEP_0194046356 /NCGR_PEP_ID=MMETSP0009_2-20130614/21019_1 /TAXON_ID=210454 /ORGANISM="Grammatophora oceanica, Strain CCMP 410" /LENGTH=94 /DNA_ID=CAMNT_0038691613 /DNA_START=42 /DNA_END=326 /DNA_ORIENTATION=-